MAGPAMIEETLPSCHMKILHLEDNAMDAEITHALFLEVWPECEVSVVDNREDFLKQLACNHDIILSDFSMANFNGLEALELARVKVPDVPFIFLSGTIGEERALEALRAGASDYLIKDRPKRLIPAMERALNDAKLERERREAADQMLRVQRLENIGMLAAGIAHDFNNVLAPVLMGVSLFRNRLTSESDQRILNAIENSAARGAGLIKQILGFAQGVTGETQLLQPKHMLRELVDMMRQTFPKNVRIDDVIENGLWPIKANPTQLHQVLLNLCVNARDAMPKGGTITIRASNRQVDEMSAASLPGATAGPYLYMAVEDSGSGIPQDIVERIWDPFFTTKGAGRGTGLGLSTVRGIVENHQGVITLTTQLGRGTTFEVLLPADPQSEAAATPGRPVEIPRGNGELVVIADDDPNVRDITSATLTDHGYRVLAAADGTEALALIAPRILEVKAVITDLDMPNLDGSALIKVVASLNPAIRIMLVSASAAADDPRRVAPPGGAFVPKPFSAETLLGTMHELLHLTPGAKAN